jgi:general secretion pathway protein L
MKGAYSIRSAIAARVADMAIPLSFDVFAPIVDRTLAAWRWWVEGLRGLVPHRLHRFVAPAHPLVILAFDRDGAEVLRSAWPAYVSRGRLALHERAGERPSVLVKALGRLKPGRIELRLPARQILRQRLVLPLAPPRRLASVLRYELERQTPFTPDLVYFDARIVERDRTARMMVAEVVLAKRSVADEALGCATGWGLAPGRLGFQGEDGWALDFRPERAVAPPGLRPYRLSAALGAAAFGLAAAAALVHIERRQDYAVALAAELASSRVAADETKALEKALIDGQGRLAFLARRRQETKILALLEELAERVPDDSWLTQFELIGQELRLQGFSAAAATLPQLFAASSLVDKARFPTPPVKTGAETERFSLSAELRETSEP